MQNAVNLEGIVEADETFFPLSFKGNHKNSKTFTMPRNPHKRGGEIHTKGLSNEQVCVPCAVNRKGQSVAKVGKLGKVSLDCIVKAFDNRIDLNSVLCTDKEKAYRKFSKDRGIELIQLDTGKSKKGIYNIQHINYYHSSLKGFLSKLKGVATKYLNNYLVWNNFVTYAKETFIEKGNIMLKFVLTTQFECKCRDISKRPIVPVL